MKKISVKKAFWRLSFAGLVVILVPSLTFNYWVARDRGGITYFKTIFSEKALKSTANDPGYEQRLSLFRSLPVPSTRPVVFAGDSRTSGAEWSELFSDYQGLVLNRGIGGDHSRGLRQRIDEIVRLRPLVVFIMIGTNDPEKGITADSTLVEHRRIIQTLKAGVPDAVIYIQSIPPTRTEKFKIWVEPVNRSLAQIASEEQVRFIDLASAFSDPQGLLKQEFSQDGIHFNGVAYQTWKALVVPEVRKYLKPLS